MSRLIFPTTRRKPYRELNEESIVINSPLSLPRSIPESILRKALPTVVMLLIIAMIVATIAMGMRIISPQTLIYPFIMLLAATGMMKSNSRDKPTTEVLDRSRSDYLRYLTSVRETIQQHHIQQREVLDWSHPPVNQLHLYISTQRQWERGHSDNDYLHLRIGTGKVPSRIGIRIKECEYNNDLEPVTGTALSQLLDHSKQLENAPVALDFTQIPFLAMVGEPLEIAAAVRAWFLQAALWHEPSLVGIAIATPDIDSVDWDWAKWLPHVEIISEIDSAGAARLLTHTSSQLASRLAPLLGQRPIFHAESNYSTVNKYYLVYIDEFTEDIAELVGEWGKKDVTVLYRVSSKQSIKPHHDSPLNNAPVMKIVDHRIYVQSQDNNLWVQLCEKNDELSPRYAASCARRLGHWNTTLVTGKITRHTRNTQTDFASLMSIDDITQLDLTQLWKRRPRVEELRVPIGITSNGLPLFFDLKDEAEGGMGPHGLMIGMTGSGKSQTLMAILLSLLTTHSAERLIVIYADFKGEAGADIFREFPQVVAVISNMADKKSLADRFADTLKGEVARREQLLKELGRQIQGSAFSSVAHYEQAIEHRLDKDDFPSIPTLFIVADEFTLMLHDHPEYAEVFDFIARKGRSFRIHILFASQTLDIGRIKDIDKNTSYRIALKVASPSISRQIIGVDNAYYIDSGMNHKGEGFIVPSPGAAPIKFRSIYVDGYYEPPRPIMPTCTIIETVPQRFIASPMQIRGATETGIREEPGTKLMVESHNSYTYAQPQQKLISVIGKQLASVGIKAPQLWLEPLDEPIGLDDICESGYHITTEHMSWPLGLIDRPFYMRKDPLIFDAQAPGANLLIHGGPQSGKSTALQTFVVSASLRYSPERIQFYIIDYGGASLSPVQDLPHVGAYTSNRNYEKIRRIFAQLHALFTTRQEFFTYEGISSIKEYRELKSTNPQLGDPYGDVFLIIDNLFAFSKDNTDVMHPKNPFLNKVIELSNIGLSYGIHVITTTTSWLEVPMAMRDSIGIKWELRLSNPSESTIRQPGALYKPAETVPADQPGRGLTPQAEHFRISLPVTLISKADYIPARTALITQIRAQYEGKHAPRVELLPNMISAPIPYKTQLDKEKISLGIKESNLEEYIHDFEHNPLLMIIGDSHSGKTNALKYILHTITTTGDPHDFACTVVDRKLHLSDINFFENNEYIVHTDRIGPAMAGLTNLMNSRKPQQNIPIQQLREWKFIGQKHYLIIDDIDSIPDTVSLTGSLPSAKHFASVSQLIVQARELGLRVIVTARASGLAQNLMTHTLLKNLYEQEVTTVMLSGNPHDPAKIRGRKFEKLPPGRSWINTGITEGEYVQLFFQAPVLGDGCT